MLQTLCHLSTTIGMRFSLDQGCMGNKILLLQAMFPMLVLAWNEETHYTIQRVTFHSKNSFFSNNILNMSSDLVLFRQDIIEVEKKYTLSSCTFIVLSSLVEDNNMSHFVHLYVVPEQMMECPRIYKKTSSLQPGRKLPMVYVVCICRVVCSILLGCYRNIGCSNSPK